LKKDGLLNPGIYLLSGNDAVVEGAIMAGCRFYAGYPITPSTEIAEGMARRMPQVDGIYVQMEDELASMGALMGASWAGVKAMTATSGLGFSLMQEHIGFAIASETPLVIVDVQRCGPASGVVAEPMQGDVIQANWGHNGDIGLIALAPASVQECFDLTIEAFNLAEKYRTPVILLSDARVGHLREKVRVPSVEEIKIINRKIAEKGERKFFLDEKGVAPMPLFGRGHHMIVTVTSHNEYGMIRMNAENHRMLVERLTYKVRRSMKDVTKIESKYMDGAEIAVVSYGTPARGALRAVRKAREEGLKVGYVRLISIWPFNDDVVKRVLNDVNEIIVVELNTGQISREIQRVANGDRNVHLVWEIGKLVPPDVIYKKVKEVVR
jgi:2-oxoglutarate ferredoxin oxidoreductase subunit alpha